MSMLEGHQYHSCIMFQISIFMNSTSYYYIPFSALIRTQDIKFCIDLTSKSLGTSNKIYPQQ